jgi:broad specificity phosphatase PhoE
MHVEPPPHGAALLDTLARLPPGAPALAVMRHSVRGPVDDLRTAPDVLLTPEGEAAARQWGESLPKRTVVRLGHSPIRRCGQTAEGIAAGAQRRGGRVELEGPDPALGAPYLQDLERLIEAARRYDPPAFVRAWFDEQLPAGIVQGADRAALELASVARARLAATPEGGLTLLVSHDWNVMLLRERLLGVRHDEAGWLDYLDGVVLVAEAGRVVLRWREHARPLPEEAS